MNKPTKQSEQPQEQSEPRHEKARELAEQALDAYAAGDRKRGDALAEQAAQTDRSAVVEVIEEIDEDAGSDPKAAERAKG